MSKSITKKWNVIIPVASGPSRSTSYQVVKTINAPTLESAVEEAEKIVEPHVRRYLRDLDLSDSTYSLRSKSLWRVQPEHTFKGTMVEKYI